MIERRWSIVWKTHWPHPLVALLHVVCNLSLTLSLRPHTHTHTPTHTHTHTYPHTHTHLPTHTQRKFLIHSLMLPYRMLRTCMMISSDKCKRKKPFHTQFVHDFSSTQSSPIYSQVKKNWWGPWKKATQRYWWGPWKKATQRYWQHFVPVITVLCSQLAADAPLLTQAQKLAEQERKWSQYDRVRVVCVHACISGSFTV